MANIVVNIAKGRVVEIYSRVKSNDPANSALILVPIETAGLESDAVLIDKATLSDWLSGTTNEQATMGRKTLTDAELAALPSPDNTNDRYDISLPAVTWAGATGNPVSKILVCYDSDTTAGTDADILPLAQIDFVATPSGTDLAMSGGVVFRAA